MTNNQETKADFKFVKLAIQKFKSNIDYFYLIVGVVFYGLIAFRWHMPLAAWIAPIFLIKFFRNQEKIKTTLIALPLLGISSFLKMRGGWDISVVFQIAVCIFLPLVIMLPLYLDRYLYRKYNSGWITLAYPALVIAIEFLLGLTLLGTAFSVGVTQIEHTAIIQVSALTGAWGVSFLIAWTAVNINQVWDPSFNLKKPPKSVKIFAIIFLVNILFGASRLAITPPNSSTVRIGSISVEHRGDYWGEIIDNNTPPESVATYSQEFQEIENELFLQSERAVGAGSKVIFWSEGNCVYFEDQEEDFLNRSAEFALANEVYFLPGVLKLNYNSTLGNNKAIMFGPDGMIKFEYEKTYSWYESESDGIIAHVDTPYGRIASTICFDNDFPIFIRQAGKANVDILLVPSFDTEVIKKFHGQTTLFRAIENGMSVIRQSNKGCSYAVDYLGNIIAYQDYFMTEDRLMISDIPTQGSKTLYPILGDWLVYISFLFLILFAVEGVYYQFKKKSLFFLKRR